jgi:hypothetical protein
MRPVSQELRFCKETKKRDQRHSSPAPVLVIDDADEPISGFASNLNLLSFGFGDFASLLKCR